MTDGDSLRHRLNKDLGFTRADRGENVRRIAEVARLFIDVGLIVLVSTVSPFRDQRRMAREMIGDGAFIEVFVDAPLEVCEQRDPEGLYRKARAGWIRNFTGIDGACEPPENPEPVLRTGIRVFRRWRTRSSASCCPGPAIRPAGRPLHLDARGFQGEPPS